VRQPWSVATTARMVSVVKTHKK